MFGKCFFEIIGKGRWKKDEASEKAKEMLQKLQEYTRNFGEIPPGLVMTGNDASKYLRKQRQEAKEQAKAGGLKDKSTETDGFINVQ